MNYKTKSNGLVLSLIAVSIFICTAFTSPAFAIGTALEAMETMDAMDTLQGAQSKSRPSRRPANNSTQEQAQTQDGRPDPARDTTNKYNEIISLINAGQALPSRTASQLLQELRTRQSSVGTFETTTLSQHYILTAWANYFNNDIKRAQQAARLAFKKNAWSKDTQLTQTALAILAGTKPAPMPKEPVMRTSSYESSSVRKETAPEMFSLDIERIDTGLIGAKIREMQLNCLNSTTLEYKYGTDNICILLWKLPSNTPTLSPTNFSEPNEPAFSPMAARSDYDEYEDEYEDEYLSEPVSRSSQKEKSKSAFSDAINAYKKLFAGSMALPNTKFVAINMDTAQSKQKILAAILQNSWPWAHVMLNDSKSNASQFNGVVVEENNPLLLVAGKTGTIKYAGPATGFLAPMVVSQLSNPSQTSSSIANIFRSNPTGNSSANTTSKTTVQKANTTSQTSRFLTDRAAVSISLEDEIQAEKLLGYAKGFIKTGSRYTTPKKGIDLCRQIIGDYPGTTYADEARLELRKVPERYRKRYNITNEELGL